MFNPHDVAVTENHAVFFSPQLAFDNASYVLGFKGPGQCIEFQDQPMNIFLQPRSGGPAQVTSPACCRISYAIARQACPADSMDYLIWLF